MKSIFESVISRGGYDLATLLARIDTYHIEGKLSDDDRTALYVAARAGAQTGDSVEIMAKLLDLDQRVKALEDQAAPGAGGESSGDEYPAYVAGKWYYAGDKVTHDGKRYTCIAPAGQVCTWSPAEYPAYWSEVAE